MSRILDLFPNLKAVEADVGVEIEVEALQELPNLEAGYGQPWWSSHEDGSLRGHSKEYVTRPIAMKVVPEAVAWLRKKIQKSDPQYSVRAGVHIHVNCQTLTFQQVINFAALYMLYEVPLVKFCGEFRQGNSFCLRTIDAEGIMDFLSLSILKNNLNGMMVDSIRYSSINFGSLHKFGTLEFRAMATYPDLSRIEEWAQVLHNLKNFSMKFDSLEQMLTVIEDNSIKTFTKQVFGDMYKLFFPEYDEHDILLGYSFFRELAFTKQFKGKN